MYPPHDLGGGAELVWRQSVEHARARGLRVRVLTTDFGSTIDDDPEVFRSLRWYWRDYEFPRVGWRERVALERHNAAVMDAQLADFAPDAVCWWAMGGMSLSLIERVRRAGVRAVGYVGDPWMVYGRRFDRWTWPFRDRPRLAALAERVTGVPATVEIGAAAEWLFCSEYTRGTTGLDLPRTAIAHPGFDAKLFAPAEPKPWNWDLLYLGRLDERKGVHVAIEALASLPREASLTLQGWGDEHYVGRLRARAAELGVNVRFRGGAPRESLPAVYAAADAVLFPVQWNEPWGLVPLEAMSVGRPVVATGTGGSGEYLRDGENCVLYSPIDSAEALAEAIRGVPDARDRLIAGGRETARRFAGDDWERAIEEALCES
jgi:glycosyltransferase involved in cell wall biosynthesis